MLSTGGHDESMRAVQAAAEAPVSALCRPTDSMLTGMGLRNAPDNSGRYSSDVRN
jgi:hypothetical protein